MSASKRKLHAIKRGNRRQSGRVDRTYCTLLDRLLEERRWMESRRRRTIANAV